MSEILVSVIMPVYNGTGFLKQCFDAIERQVNKKNVEIILIDNKSKDSTLDLAIKYSHKVPNLKILEEKDVQSSYAARNKGIDAAKGIFLAFTDIDCRPDRLWLDRCLYHAKVNEQTKIISGPVVLVPNNEKYNLFELYDVHSALKQKKYADKNFGATANLLVPKKIFQEIGYFNVVASGGDQEFCKRTVRNGYEFEFDDKMLVQHPARSNFYALKKKAIRVGKGLADNNQFNRISLRQRMAFISRQVIGVFFPRYQFGMIKKVVTEYELNLKESVCFAFIAICLGNLQRLSFIKNTFWGSNILLGVRRPR